MFVAADFVIKKTAVNKIYRNLIRIFVQLYQINKLKIVNRIIEVDKAQKKRINFHIISIIYNILYLNSKKKYIYNWIHIFQKIQLQKIPTQFR